MIPTAAGALGQISRSLRALLSVFKARSEAFSPCRTSATRPRMSFRSLMRSPPSSKTIDPESSAHVRTMDIAQGDSTDAGLNCHPPRTPWTPSRLRTGSRVSLLQAERCSRKAVTGREIGHSDRPVTQPSRVGSLQTSCPPHASLAWQPVKDRAHSRQRLAATQHEWPREHRNGCCSLTKRTGKDDDVVQGQGGKVSRQLHWHVPLCSERPVGGYQTGSGYWKKTAV